MYLLTSKLMPVSLLSRMRIKGRKKKKEAIFKVRVSRDKYIICILDY